MANLNERNNVDSGIKSGSGWGENELDIYRFEKIPKRHPPEGFPWCDIFQNRDLDPIADITPILEDIFSLESESGDSSNVGSARTFFNMLRILTSQYVPWDAKAIPKTRSKVVDYSSPSLASAATQHFESSSRGCLDHKVPMPLSTPSEVVSGIPGPEWLHRHPEVEAFSPKFHVLEREQSPIAALIERRGRNLRDPESTPTRIVAWDTYQSSEGCEDSSPEVDHDMAPENIYSQLPQQLSNYSRTYTQVLASDTNLPSSESDSSYRAKSSLLPASSQSDFMRSSPPTIRAPGYADQAEDCTNSMMYALLSTLCDIISESPTSLSTKTEFLTSSDTETLMIPTGNGGFVKTTPDLKVLVEKSGRSMTILDYEGKRLKPNMTSIEKYAQSVAHLIGRASWNRSTGATSSRNVYLLTAQHTSISIMQCTLLHKWLDRLPSELHTLKSFARIQVQEYGPLDLANGQERLTAVQMMCRLILGLGMATKLSVVEDQLPNDAQVSREEFIEGVFTGDEINSQQ